jgi:hypothetical protein
MFEKRWVRTVDELGETDGSCCLPVWNKQLKLSTQI